MSLLALSLEALLHPLPGVTAADAIARADYHYSGDCPTTGQCYHLPRTALAKAVAQDLMAQLPDASLNQRPEGKMYGVLLVATDTDQVAMLKAFSGLWQGCDRLPGWVPPMPGREQVALHEARTLREIQIINDRLREIQTQPDRTHLAELRSTYDRARDLINQRHRDRKQARAIQRQTQALTADDLATLEQQSRADKAELRQFKQEWRDRLAPLEAAVQAADAEIAALKRQRRDLSRQLQAALHAAYTLTNFAGNSAALEQLGALPTGTGDCCAPKLLHAAATRGLTPLALAEFWWGPPQGDKQPGRFYGACAERCQPIMGFLLGGLSARVLSGAPVSPAEGCGNVSPADVPILYQDRWIIAVDKPAGLLAVPGRYGDRQDSALSRLRLTLPPAAFLQPVHRLDQDTSGLLLFARDAETHRHLNQQFAQRRVQKTYQAVLAGHPSQLSGVIDLPLRGDPAQRPRQMVDWQSGKPSQTRFEVLAQTGDVTRVAFYPLTGRTHQLRVHAAVGLQAPIVGDRLYGSPAQRLHLHAQTLTIAHPHRREPLTLNSAVPF